MTLRPEVVSWLASRGDSADTSIDAEAGKILERAYKRAGAPLDQKKD